MKLKIRYERPEIWTVTFSPLMQEYDANGESGMTGINTSTKMKAEMGESNQSGWDDMEEGITQKSLWDD